MLNMIEYFQRENEVFLINWQRDPGRKNNFRGISHVNIQAPMQLGGLFSFCHKVLRIGSDINFNLGYCASVRLIPVLKILCRKKNAALVYDSIEIPSLLGAQKLASRLKFVSPRLLQFFLEVGERVLLRMTDGALVIDSKGEKLLHNMRKVQPNCECIMNYPSRHAAPDRDEARRFRERFAGRKIVVYAGSMFAAKGLYKYMELIDRLRSHEPLVLLVMVGMLRFGEDWSSIETYVKERNLEEHVCFLPWMSYSKVLALLQNARVGLALQDPDFFYFQFASVGNSRKHFTYMLAGVPAVVSLPAIGRFVEEKGIGRMVDFYDLDSICNAVKEVLKNDSLQAEMGRRGKMLVQTECNWEKEIAKVEKVCERAMSARKH
jgi:glycosyltransferase involved in cell wall biosynthesis